ncbi:MAG: head protein [Deltaproteobacteria bacterium HGW-Deltaproteobacteria-8]|jgi:phage major head subunit gpT-like protein|nr:MAG: head protein [Deltaproteobacteria bacterium HGW-Deltaproteobacteria-8]
MAIITPALIAALMTGFRAEYQRVFGETPSDCAAVATTVPSSSKSNTYGWLGQFPQLIEWVGSRVVKDMAAHGYSITNKLFEGTVGVPRTDIEDDEVGVYKPLFGEMGRAAKTHPDVLIFALLKAGLTTLCFDGQNFFDTDHPVYPNVDGTGVAETVANYQAGTGEPWFLLDCSRVLKPFIFQERTKPEMTALTDPKDEAVFDTDTYRFGTRYRCNVGFGFWQLAYMSKAELTTDNFNAAYATMCGFKTDGGRPLGVRPTLLVGGPTQRTKILEIVKSTRLANGQDNINQGVVEALVTPWLA